MAMESHAESGDEECSNRPANEKDLRLLCREFNTRGVRYVVVGGFAIVNAGYPRFTLDLDFLIETTPANEAAAIDALLTLPEKVAAELRPGDVNEYSVVRVSDEFMVDLMKSGCGVTYHDAIQDAVWRELDGVRIPFASKQTLWKMKQTLREKDIPDRLFLRQALEADGIPLDPAPSAKDDPLANCPSRLKRFLAWVFKRRD